MCLDNFFLSFFIDCISFPFLLVFIYKLGIESPAIDAVVLALALRRRECAIYASVDARWEQYRTQNRVLRASKSAELAVDFFEREQNNFFLFRRDAHRLMTDHHFSQFPSRSQVGSECGGRVRVEETKDQAEAINNSLVRLVMFRGEQ